MASRGGHVDVGAPSDYLLSAMTLAEALEISRLHRVSGLTGHRRALVTTRPCRAPLTLSPM